MAQQVLKNLPKGIAGIIADRSRMGTSKWFVRARNLLGLFRLKLQPTGIKDGVSLEPASNPNNTNTNNPLQSNSVVAPNGLVQDFFTISKPTIFAPLSTQFPQARLNFIKDQVNLDFSAMQAVDHRKSPWSPSQAQRSDVMVGPRFTQVDFEKQPSPRSAQEYVDAEPPVMIVERKVMCDGGGVLGHPRIYINLDQADQVMPCMYCGKRFMRDPSHHQHH